ncbi:MAG: hypothetical protein ACI83D_000303 [Planctomycetota bacterium]|jgi:hypothetical protein
MKRALLIILLVLVLGFFIAQVAQSIRGTDSEDMFQDIPDTTVVEDTELYSIKVVIPGVAPTVAAREIGSFIHGEIEDFIALGEDLFMVRESDRWTLDITYSLHEFDEWVTFVVHEAVYMGGAHGISTITSFTYDRSSGKRILLHDFVTKRQLVTLSNLAEKTLLNQIGIQSDQGFISSGTEPRYDNFDTFFLTPEGVVFVFQMYQVAPYSAGVPEILIPYEQFEKETGLPLLGGIRNAEVREEVWRASAVDVAQKLIEESETYLADGHHLEFTSIAPCIKDRQADACYEVVFIFKYYKDPGARYRSRVVVRDGVGELLGDVREEK